MSSYPPRAPRAPPPLGPPQLAARALAETGSGARTTQRVRRPALIHMFPQASRRPPPPGPRCCAE
eukprot:11608884-Alexandrium_andersonii.AAC.1